MGFLFVLLFPTLLWGGKPSKAAQPQWICEGYVQGYDELDSEIVNRWKTVKTLKFDGPTEVNNMATTEITFDKVLSKC